MRNFAEQLESGRAGLSGNPSDLMGEMTANLPPDTTCHWTVDYDKQYKNGGVIRGGLHETEEQAIEGFRKDFNSPKADDALKIGKAKAVFIEPGAEYQPWGAGQEIIFKHERNDGFGGSTSAFKDNRSLSEWAKQQRSMAEANRQK